MRPRALSLVYVTFFTLVGAFCGGGCTQLSLDSEPSDLITGVIGGCVLGAIFGSWLAYMESAPRE